MAEETMLARAASLALARTYAGAAVNYWMYVFPRVRRECKHWRGCAEQIPDAVLRASALHAQQIKRPNVEGSAAFGAFAPHARRNAVVRAQVAFQSIYDYVDTLAEQQSQRPIANAHQLHRALLAALQQDLPQPDYYAHQDLRDDGGYLEGIVQACRAGLATLPSYASISAVVRRIATRIVCYQSLNLNESQGGQQALARWASRATPDGTGLKWWETAASAGSSLGVFALITAAARPDVSSEHAIAIERAYWPWVGALHSLLDSVTDEAEDANAAHRNLLDYYGSPEEAARRLKLLAVEAQRRTSRLPNAHQHTVILAGMAGSYLSIPPASERGRLVARAVLDTIGGLAVPTLLIFRARRAAGDLLSPRG
jgi:tetraprenyl-beta-curcumene synthase